MDEPPASTTALIHSVSMPVIMREFKMGHERQGWAQSEGRKHSLPANTKHLYDICTMLDQRRRRWADVVQMLYKCFVFAGSPMHVM